MKFLTPHNLKVLLAFGCPLAAAFLIPNSPAKAACSGSVTSNCYITPTKYVIKVYEMGLCTEDPLSGTYIDANDNVVTDSSIDESSCTPTLKSINGIDADLAGGASASLTGQNIRPPAGTYPHAYIKIKNTFGLKGSYDNGTNTYCSSGIGSQTSVAGCTPSEWDEDLMDFSNGRTCNTTASDVEMAGSEVFTTGITGTMKAVLAKPSSDGSYVADSSCGSSTRLFGSFQPTAPIVITESTQGLQVTFSITNRGMTVLPDGSGGVSGFSSGPFSPSFDLF